MASKGVYSTAAKIASYGAKYATRRLIPKIARSASEIYNRRFTKQKRVANRLYNDAANMITANFTVSDTATLESAK